MQTSVYSPAWAELIRGGGRFFSAKNRPPPRRTVPLRAWQKSMKTLHHEIFMAVLAERHIAMQISHALELPGTLFSWQEDAEAPNDEKILLIRGAGSAVFMASGLRKLPAMKISCFYGVWTGESAWPERVESFPP